MSTGRRISRYMILRQLGHGNLTRIFLATPRPSDRRELCVLKLMHTELTSDEDFRALFLDQAATTLSLRHPNIVQTLDVVADAEACGLTMEFLEGQTLARLIERMGRNRFPVDMHLHVLSKVLAALEYAHTLPRSGESRPGFFHGDVSPNKVLLTYDGEVKLLGVGFAEAVRALESKLGRPVGDARYAAPEVLLGHAAGPSSDLFGVGLMLWEAVARQARLGGDDRAVISRQRTNGEEPDLESAWPDAPVPVIEMCRRALSLDPSSRYQSASELRSDLDAYLGRASQSSEAVLRRLAESMQALFAAEREQMQLFIGSTLDSANDRPIAAPSPAIDSEDDLTPHEGQWNGPTGARIPTLDMLATGNLALVANVSASGSEQLEPASDTRDSGQTSAPSQTPTGLGTASLDLGATPSSRQAPRMMPLEIGPLRESSTGGHRAYSSSLEASSRRSGRLRLSPDLLGAAALILGSIVAAYSLHRHSMRDKRPEREELAIQAESPGDAPASRSGSTDSQSGGVSGDALAFAPSPGAEAPGRMVEAPLSDRGARQPSAPARREAPSIVGSDADAGSSLAKRAAASAFFEGSALAPKVTAADTPLHLDDLPAVDPALDSLQDAILTQARRRPTPRELERDKRDRKSEPGAASANAGSVVTRPSDGDDLWIAPRSTAGDQPP